ncbi:MAG: hypothetical protein FWE71_01025 [Nocardioidaceae bacterium]|nr:hypothetical protein [Nocardioidaceae bacterium]MCL2612705.1 hypothetical protein [Nocardioidaceae bacterium]
MIRRGGRRLACGRDEGAILIFALIIVTTIALVVGTLLTRGDGSLEASLQLRNTAGSSYAADAAANIAINDLRNGTGSPGFNNNDAEAAFDNNPNDGLGCFGGDVGAGGTDGLFLKNFYARTSTIAASSAYVECTGETGTGQEGTPVPITDKNKPGQAILALGVNSTKGLSFGQSGAETDYIHGSVTSNSTLTSKGTLNVTGNGVKVNAPGGCAGAVQINGSAATCGSMTIGDPGDAGAAPTTTPALAAAPTCPTANGGPEVFSPGLYTMTPDAAGVSPETQAITLSNNTTGGTFTPTLSGYGAAPAQQWNVTPAALQTALRSTWSIAVNVTGTVGTSGTTGSVYSITFPTILGDVATMTAPSALSKTTGKSPSATVTTPTAGSSTCTKTVGWMYFAPSSASTGVYYFDWTGTWSLSGTIVGGTLSLANDGKTDGGTSISPGGGAAAPTSAGSCVSPTLDPGAVGDELVFGGSSQVDMSGNNLKEFCATYSSTSIPTVVYGLKSAVGSGATQVPAQNGCIVSSSPCAMINAATGSKAQFYFEGFVYAPWAYINLDANNISQPFFDFGLIADSMFIGANPSTKCVQCAFVNLPDDSLGYGYDNSTVDLTVYLCLGQSTCSASSGTKALTARVQLWDPSGTPVASKRQVTVLSWSHSN